MEQAESASFSVYLLYHLDGVCNALATNRNPSESVTKCLGIFLKQFYKKLISSYEIHYEA